MQWSPISNPSAAVEPGPSDREWFVPLAFLVLVETLLWFAAYLKGYAAEPMVTTYGSLAIIFLVAALSWKAVALLVNERPSRPAYRLAGAVFEHRERIAIAILGSFVLALGSSAFGSLKAGIPHAIPFWFDVPESRFEDWLLGAHPAMLIDFRIPWILPYFDRLYATFVPTIIVAMLALLASRPSREKSRALVALALAWLVIGVFAAYLCSSAGPIFYDRVYGGHKFAALIALLQRQAPLTVLAADMLWASHQSGIPGFGDGISAFPSMHVAMTMWLALVLNRTRFAALAWTYYALIWIGSMLLGWHWGIGGLGGSLLMLMLWKIAPRLLFVKGAQAQAELAAVPIPAGAGCVTAETVGG